MKQGMLISIVLIALGFIFECIHFATDFELFGINFLMLGAVFMVLGVLRMIRSIVVPALNKRAETLGEYKKKQLKNNNNST